MADADPGIQVATATEPQVARHYLFLQGLPGPFFQRLGKALAAEGARVSRVNFSAGDWFDWRGEGVVAFRGPPADWPGWLAHYVAAEGVTDIVVFGDCREYHRPARDLADRSALRFWAFEEGYLRPDHVTLERGGVNGNSSFPRSLHAIRLLAERLPCPDEPEGMTHRFRARAGEAARHHAATIFGRPFFPRYRTHRHNPPAREAVAWVTRRMRRAAERRDSRAALDALGDRPFFLHPLQLEGDSQLRMHSSFASMVEAMERVVVSFAHAPSDRHLLVKMHPLDPCLIPWRQRVAEAATAAGIADRVHFVERADLDPLLGRTLGVVTVNSTVGPLALARNVPVLALGDAIYRVSGITADTSLEEFWRNPRPVDPDNFLLMTRALRAKCLINGGFHSAEGLDRLVRHSVERMLRP